VAPYDKRIAAVTILFIFFLFVTAGCGVITDLLSGITGGDNGEPAVEADSGLAPENLEGDQGSQEAEETAAITDPFEVTLYFAGQEGNSLLPEVRTIQKTEGIARATMEQLIAGPGPGSELLPTIPQGTSLLDINVKEDGLCIVDFSGELLSEGADGVIPDNLMVYSIVNTLAEFPTIEKVQFRINGQEVESLGDNLPAMAPLTPNPGLIGVN